MATDRIIVALDVPSGDQALDLVRKLKDSLTFFKVGSALFTREGPEIVKKIRAEGVDVFLDLKFHDIPQTVIGSMKSAVALGVRFVTVHTTGGAEMMLAAQIETANSNTEVLGVTVLTSMDNETLGMVGFDHSVPGQVMR